MIYEYRCSSCGDIQEVWQKMSDPGPESCAKCGAPQPEKIISKTSFALKGTGWYTTDYKRAPAASAPAASSALASETPAANAAVEGTAAPGGTSEKSVPAASSEKASSSSDKPNSNSAKN